jgi:uncharacterized membrane protein YoaK (UPF0700 family)
MTGNVVFLAFAVAGVPGLSAARSAASLLAFLVGALCGGRIGSRRAEWPKPRLLRLGGAIEAALLLVAAGAAAIAPAPAYVLIVLTALAMGVRNAVVRKIAVPDLTTTVLTLTVTGLAADSSLAGGTNPRWGTRVTAIVIMFGGAAVGAFLLRYGLAVPLAVSGVIALGVCAILARGNA